MSLPSSLNSSNAFTMCYLLLCRVLVVRDSTALGIWLLRISVSSFRRKTQHLLPDKAFLSDRWSLIGTVHKVTVILGTIGSHPTIIFHPQVPIIFRKYTSAARSMIFLNSCLQVVCDTPIARITGCVSSVRISLSLPLTHF